MPRDCRGPSAHGFQEAAHQTGEVGEPVGTADRDDLDDAVAKELKAFGGAEPTPGPVPGAVVAVWIPGKGSYVRAVGDSNLAPKTAMALTDKLREAA